MRVIVNARGPSVTLKLRPVLLRTLAAVETARRYSGLLLESMPDTRTLLPLFNASSFNLNFVFSFIGSPSVVWGGFVYEFLFNYKRSPARAVERSHYTSFISLVIGLVIHRLSD